MEVRTLSTKESRAPLPSVSFSGLSTLRFSSVGTEQVTTPSARKIPQLPSSMASTVSSTVNWTVTSRFQTFPPSIFPTWVALGGTGPAISGRST